MTLLCCFDHPDCTCRRPLIAKDEGRGEVLLGGFAGATLQKPGAEPKFNLVLPKGKWHGPNFAKLGGSIDITDAMIAEIVANWEAAGKPRLPIRWGHEHLHNDDPAKQALLDRKAGNLLELRATDAGLEALTAWNELGAKDIEQGAFDAWSPEWYPSHVSRKTGETRGWWLSGVALTGDPYFHLMPPVAASTTSTEPNPQHRSNTMNEEQLKALRAKFGLAADATVEQINAKIDALMASAKTPTAEVITAAVAPVQAQVAELQKKLDEEKAKGLKRDVDALVAKAERGDGKTGRSFKGEGGQLLIATAGKIAKDEGIEAAEKFLNALPLTPGLSITAIGVDTKDQDGLSAAAANEKLNVIANELQAKGDKTPMETAMRLNPALTKAVRGLSVSTKSN